MRGRWPAVQRADRSPKHLWWRSVCLRIRLTAVPSSSHGRTDSRRALSSRQMMALEAARLYHLRGLDQAAVAQVLHVSRPQVSKLLATARESGYIRTHVVDPRESDRELVQTLTQRFDRNAVGHLCGRFIDADGRVVAPTLGQRTSSPTLAQLRRSKRTVLITYGARQIEFVRAAALAGYVDHIVTDVSTAELLLKYT